MPSLRRTNSSPSARSSPYRSYLSSSSSSQTRTGARSPRRSSGSETTNRRVLADIDWWRVEESQREVRGLAPSEALHHAAPSADEEERDQEEREPLPAPRLLDFAVATAENAGAAPLWHNIPGGGLDTFEVVESRFSLWSAGEVDLNDPSESSTPLEQFAALSLNPVGRASLERADSISSAFSDTSFSSDSTFSTPTLSPMGMNFGFSDCVDVPTADSDDENDSRFSVLSHATRRPARAPMRSTRSVSYSFIEDQLSNSRSRRDAFDDDWSSPSSPSSTSYNDEDDPFF